ncbi:MAG: diaminopimelate epimerase, partial [Actinomycetota bacterium]
RVVLSSVSMGNPHAVLFVADVDAAPVERLGPRLEHHPAFPNRVNVEFVEVVDRRRVRQRTWERGVGETLACGSGACAVAVAANEAGLAPARVTIRFPGGDVEVERREGGEVCLTGPAVHVFDGTVDLEALARA